MPGGNRTSDGYVGGARPNGREILPPLTYEHDRVRGQQSYDYPEDESYPPSNRPGGRGPSRGGSSRDYDRGYDESAVGWDESSAGWEESAAGWEESASYEPPARGRGPVSRSRGGAYGSQRSEAGWDESIGGFRIPADAPEDEGRTRNRRRVLTIVLSLLLIPVIVVPIVLLGPQLASRLRGQGQQTAGNTAQPFATYTPGPTPTVLPNYKLFTGQQEGYLVNYPSNWTVRSDDKPGSGHDHIDTFQSTTTASVYSVEQASTFDNFSDEDILNGEVRGAEQNGATFTLAPGTAASQVVGGENWLRREYAVSYQGKALHMVILVCHHHGKGYVIVVSTLDKDYASEAQKYFTPMLQSFRFAS